MNDAQRWLKIENKCPLRLRLSLFVSVIDEHWAGDDDGDDDDAAGDDDGDDDDDDDWKLAHPQWFPPFNLEMQIVRWTEHNHSSCYLQDFHNLRSESILGLFSYWAKPITTAKLIT